MKVNKQREQRPKLIQTTTQEEYTTRSDVRGVGWECRETLGEDARGSVWAMDSEGSRLGVPGDIGRGRKGKRVGHG